MLSFARTWVLLALGFVAMVGLLALASTGTGPAYEHISSKIRGSVMATAPPLTMIEGVALVAILPCGSLNTVQTPRSHATYEMEWTSASTLSLTDLEHLSYESRRDGHERWSVDEDFG